MRTTSLLVLSCLVVLGGAATAAAQGRVPAQGMWGLGASIGAAVPADASLQNGVELAGTLENYLTPRVSIRGQLGGAWSDITGRTFSGTVRPVYVDGNVVYNWEGGVVHPYVTGGVGLYRFHTSESGAPDSSDTKAGFNVGGGIELFFTRRATMTTELLYHKVDSFDSALTRFNDGSFWRFAIGAKTYF
jgi:outer membrane protein with beta-barrel domain